KPAGLQAAAVRKAGPDPAGGEVNLTGGRHKEGSYRRCVARVDRSRVDRRVFVGANILRDSIPARVFRIIKLGVLPENLLEGLALSRQPALLLPELRKCVTHWSARNLKHPIERAIQFQDQENRAGDRQGANKQRDESGCVRRREQTKACQNESKPRNHYHK